MFDYNVITRIPLNYPSSSIPIATTPSIFKYPLKLVLLDVFESAITRAILEALHSNSSLLHPVIGSPSTPEL